MSLPAKIGSLHGSGIGETPWSSRAFVFMTFLASAGEAYL
jgi:hypothetical protein